MKYYNWNKFFFNRLKYNEENNNIKYYIIIKFSIMIQTKILTNVLNFNN